METGISVIHNFADVQSAATAMAKSGYFQDSRDQAQAIVKILAGQELGFGPFSSMTGVYIIQGRPSIGANLMAAAVKSSEKYNYRLIENTEKAVEIAFFERDGGKWVEIGRSRFTHEDAVKAGTKNLDKFPRNMLFARAISNGVRWYCPDVFNGSPVYTPEELGADVDQEGNIIEVVATEVEKPNLETPHKAEPVSQKSDEPDDEYSGVCTEEGKPYSELNTKELSVRWNSLSGKRSKNPDTFSAEDQRKLDAIKFYMQQSRAASSGA